VTGGLDQEWEDAKALVEALEGELATIDANIARSTSERVRATLTARRESLARDVDVAKKALEALVVAHAVTQPPGHVKTTPEFAAPSFASAPAPGAAPAPASVVIEPQTLTMSAGLPTMPKPSPTTVLLGAVGDAVAQHPPEGSGEQKPDDEVAHITVDFLERPALSGDVTDEQSGERSADKSADKSTDKTSDPPQGVLLDDDERTESAPRAPSPSLSLSVSSPAAAPLPSPFERLPSSNAHLTDVTDAMDTQPPHSSDPHTDPRGEAPETVSNVEELIQKLVDQEIPKTPAKQDTSYIQVFNRVPPPSAVTRAPAPLDSQLAEDEEDAPRTEQNHSPFARDDSAPDTLEVGGSSSSDESQDSQRLVMMARSLEGDAVVTAKTWIVPGPMLASVNAGADEVVRLAKAIRESADGGSVQVSDLPAKTGLSLEKVLHTVQRMVQLKLVEIE
jgi:hypothetical protein